MAVHNAAPCARDLMERLRVVLGARETIGEAARRLRAHSAAAAPIVSSGRPVGIVTRALAENALRHSLASVPALQLAGGGAPRVSPFSDLSVLRRASECVAPAFLVCHARGPLLGIVTRHRLDEALERLRRLPVPPPWLLGRDVGARMNTKLGEERATVLKRASGLAAAHGIALYLVGGVARDVLRGSPGEDLDLAVEGDGVVFAEELGRLLGGHVTRHETFGTAIVRLPQGLRIDVATARRETYDRPAVLPRVAPGTMVDDLLRRDVTMNSMGIRLDGAHYGRLRDDLGGVRDLATGRLRVNHLQSMVEDPTRAYRVARFAGRFGFEPTRETMSSIDLARRHQAFGALTGERLHREFAKVALEPDPIAALDWCGRLALLDHLGPGLKWDRAARVAAARLLKGLRGDLFAEDGGAFRPDLLLIMILSLKARPAQRESLAERLRITGEARERLRDVPAKLRGFLRSLGRAGLPSRVTRLCETASPELVKLAWATGATHQRRRIESYLRVWRAVRLVVTGKDLLAMGLPPGPEYAVVLEMIRTARLDGRVKDPAQERALARDLVRKRTKQHHGSSARG